jgi:hypothetical protein
MDDLDELERELGPSLRLALRRAAAEIAEEHPPEALSLGRSGPATPGAWFDDAARDLDVLEAGCGDAMVVDLESRVDDWQSSETPLADLAPEPERGPRTTTRRWLVVAAAATIIVIVAAVLVYRSGDDTTDIVPTGPGPTVTTPTTTTRSFSERLNAFPPEGAIPSTPETGVLLPNLPSLPVFVYEDGRVISSRFIGLDGFRWKNWFEQRLTHEGLELVKAEIRDGGRLDHSPPPPRGGPIGWVYEDGDRVLITKTDPDLSWLPASAWQDPEPTLFVPSKYLVCLSGTGDASAILAGLPAAAAEPFARATRSEGGPTASPNGLCFDFATDDARKLAAALHAAGAAQPQLSNPFSYGFGHYDGNLNWVGVGIQFTAYLPHGNPVICCGG